MKRATWLVLFLALASCEEQGGEAKSGATPSAPPEPTTTPASEPSTTASTTASATAEAPTPSRPLYYRRPIRKADLEGRSLRELSLMRNQIFARAGNAFRRPWLKAYFEQQDWYEAKEEMNEDAISDLDRANARTIGEHVASITQKELEKRRDELLARKKAGKARPQDDIEISLISQRLGVWIGDEDAERTPLEDPSELDELISISELEKLSRRDLRILRNTVYARRGRSFDSEVVQGYFAATVWYEPRPDYHDGLLTPVDRKNIALIRSVEDSLGGPVHENPRYGEAGWFVMA